MRLGGAGSRVVKSLGCGARVLVRIPVASKVLGSDGMIVNIYLYEFILCLVGIGMRICCFGLY